MPKNQKSVSFPKQWMEEIEEYYKTHEEELKLLDVDSPTALVRILANFGKSALADFLRNLKPEDQHLREEEKP